MQIYNIILIDIFYNGLNIQENLAPATQCHSVIATNADTEEMSADEVVRFYRKRGDTSEKRIKELKGGFSIDRLPFYSSTKISSFRSM